jgi:hypothetical protein
MPGHQIRIYTIEADIADFLETVYEFMPGAGGGLVLFVFLVLLLPLLLVASLEESLRALTFEAATNIEDGKPRLFFWVCQATINRSDRLRKYTLNDCVHLSGGCPVDCNDNVVQQHSDE